MGMRANYQFLSDEQYVELKNLETEDLEAAFDAVEDWNEEEEILLDIDKMWDVLHFVLNGVGATEPKEGNPLSEAVLGEHVLDEVEEFISYTSKERIPAILEALEEFDIERAMEKFRMKECEQAGLYPNIWEYDDEEEIEELKEEITDCFEEMKHFYREVLENNGNVLVTIY